MNNRLVTLLENSNYRSYTKAELDAMKKYCGILEPDRLAYLKRIENKLDESINDLVDNNCKDAINESHPYRRPYNSLDPNTWTDDNILQYIKDCLAQNNSEGFRKIVHMISKLDRASDELIRSAVELHPGCFEYFAEKFPISTQLQLWAVQQADYIIDYVPKPIPPLIQWAAINAHPTALFWMNIAELEPSLKRQYHDFLVKNDLIKEFDNLNETDFDKPLSLDEQTIVDRLRDLKKEFVSTHSIHIDFYADSRRLINRLDDPSIECQKQIVAIDGLLLGCLDTDNTDVIRIALERNPFAIKHVKHQTITMQLFAVIQNGAAIEYCNHHKPMIQWAAVRKYTDLFKIGHVISVIEPEDLDPSLKTWWEEKQKAQLTESKNSTDPNDWIEAEQIDYVKQNYENTKRIKHPSEAVQLAAVQRDGWAIQYIENPPEEVQLAAVQQNGAAIYWIINPSLEVQLAAVQQNGYAIQYITNPTIPVQLAAVQRNGQAIKYITDPTIPVQLAAVQQDGLAIQFIKNPLPMIQTAACKQKPKSINVIKPIESTNIGLMKKYRDELNDERLAYLEQIENEPLTESTKTPVVDDNSRFVNKWSESTQIEYVKEDWENIKDITNPSLEVQLAAVQQDGFAIYYIKNPDLPVQLAAVQQNGWAIQLITNPTPLIQTAACFQKPTAINRINPIESTNISLMKKYRDELNDKRRAYLERIENETLTESKLKSGTFDIEYWISSPYQAKFELTHNTTLFDRERYKEGLIKKTATATIEAIDDYFECRLNNSTVGQGPTITAAIYATLPKTAKYLSWQRK